MIGVDFHFMIGAEIRFKLGGSFNFPPRNGRPRFRVDGNFIAKRGCVHMRGKNGCLQLFFERPDLAKRQTSNMR